MGEIESGYTPNEIQNNITDLPKEDQVGLGENNDIETPKVEAGRVQDGVEELALSDEMSNDILGRENVEMELEGAREGLERIQELRDEIGLEGEGDNFVGDNISYLEEQRQKLDDKISEQEREFLEVPDEGAEESRSIESIIENMENMEEAMRKELKEEREKFIKEFINNSTDTILQDFKTHIDESKNGKKAEQLIKDKIFISINKRAEDYIKNGSEIDLTFSMSIELSSFENLQGETDIYITNVDINIEKGGKESIGRNELASADANEELVDAEAEGELEVNKVA